MERFTVLQTRNGFVTIKMTALIIVIKMVYVLEENVYVLWVMEDWAVMLNAPIIDSKISV